MKTMKCSSCGEEALFCSDVGCTKPPAWHEHDHDPGFFSCEKHGPFQAVSSEIDDWSWEKMKEVK